MTDAHVGIRKSRRRVVKIAGSVAATVLILYLLFGGPFSHFLEWSGFVSRPPGDYDGSARSALLRETWNQDAFFEQYEMYEGPWGEYWPFHIDEERVLFPVSADESHYEIVAFHLKGKKAFSIKGPFPEGADIRERDKIRKKNMKEIPREKAISLAVEPYVELLKRDFLDPNLSPDNIVQVRCTAARTLGELGDSRAFEHLVAALKDEDVKFVAAIGLSRLKDVRAIEPLIEALKDENRIMRQEAAEALGYLKDARAVEPLIEAMEHEYHLTTQDDENHRVTEYVMGKALKSITGQDVPPYAHEWRNWWAEQQGVSHQRAKNDQDGGSNQESSR